MSPGTCAFVIRLRTSMKQRPIPFTVERASEGDARELGEICSRTFITTYEGKHSDGRPKNWVHDYTRDKFQESALLAELRSPKVEIWVARVETRIVGYFKLIQEAPLAILPDRNLACLERIYLMEASQGLGIGKALLTQAATRARGLGFNGLWLGVWEENRAAIAYYLRHGFTRAGMLEWVAEYDDQRYVDIDELMVRVDDSG